MRCKRIDAGKCGRSKIKIRILETKTGGKFYKSVKFSRSAKTKYPSAIQSSAPQRQTTTKSRFANFVLFGIMAYSGGGTSVKFDLRRFSSRLSQDVNQKAKSRRLRYEFIKRAGIRRYEDG